MSQAPKRSRRTRLVHMGRVPTPTYGFVNPPVHRGSTVVYPNVAERDARRAHPFDQVLTYGAQGGPTHYYLEDAIAELEGGTRCQLLPTGLAAVTTALLAYLKSGDHCLVPDSVYGPCRRFCDTLGAQLGIETTYYAPEIEAPALRALMRANTRVVYAESPGSHTMEVQDVPMLARVAHEAGAGLLLDNTWGITFFQPFEHGVDCSIQAATKYIGGHSDILLGAITTATEDDWKRVRSAATTLGQYASPDDCWLALRGLRTLGVRLEAQMRSGLQIASWLRDRPEVADVLHPGLPGAPGHEIWKRDFTGACSLFTVELRQDISVQSMRDMIDALDLFQVGASWGGFESLVLPTTNGITRTASGGKARGPLFRLHIGLESVDELIADLDRALGHLAAGPARA